MPLPDYTPEVNGTCLGTWSHPRARQVWRLRPRWLLAQIHGHKHVAPGGPRQVASARQQVWERRPPADGRRRRAAVETGALEGVAGLRRLPPRRVRGGGVATYGGVVRYGKTESRARRCPKPGFVDHASGVLPATRATSPPRRTRTACRTMAPSAVATTASRALAPS